MTTTISGTVGRLDGAPEPQAYIVATLAGTGENLAVLAGGPVARQADVRGQIVLPLDIHTETQVHLRLAIPGRTLREATVSLRPGVAYDLAQIFSGAASPTPSPAPVPGMGGVEISGDGDTLTLDGTLYGDIYDTL
ncbi:hypothetical protein FBF35_07670 [Schaalia odontolytica]|uniref:Uncharacterized protein n=1 Tax=Schaalia odontolytica TaxID=1660 RepID=A0A0V8RQJ7_9ACTO|nr:hypothetical protein [Schaalia odontolytica]AVJ50963.1 hypothetical protein XHP1_00026 [Actinomyces phage xhp1]KSW10189.1 hypothetical protein APY09_09285 [Schaalia odontolytica]QCT35864.1 hypothetical protein FBF35_07485 [Schaalia odontolytica]QCT35899.1 hypothetical protein FBF35_07670 [Schaalia odontolytica]